MGLTQRFWPWPRLWRPQRPPRPRLYPLEAPTARAAPPDHLVLIEAHSLPPCRSLLAHPASNLASPQEPPNTPRDFARLLLLPRDFSSRPCWSHLLLEALPPPSPLRFVHHTPGPQPFPSEHVCKKLCPLSPLDCDHLPFCCGPGAQRNRGGPWGTDRPSPTGPCCQVWAGGEGSLGPAGAPRRAGEGRSRWLRSHHRHGDR